MVKSDYLSFLNVSGAVCSILALTLTLAQNTTFATIIELLIAIVFLIAVAAVLGGLAYRFEKWLIESNFWPYHLLYWLVAGLAILTVSFIVALSMYALSSFLLMMVTQIMRDVMAGTF